MYYDINKYEFVGFEVSKAKNKKYTAFLKNLINNKLVKVNFGDKRYEQFKDAVLGVYSNKNHYDPNRRRLYRMRHLKDLKKGYYSAGYFSYYYLW